jgi:putative dehydrogenase
MTDVDVGVIGLGAMGGSIARNLVGAGLGVVGFDVLPGRRDALISAGGTACESVAAVAAVAPVILTLLPSPEALDEVAAAIANGLADHAERPILVEMSTLSEEAKVRARDELERVGVVVLDCPLSGTAAQAEVGDLVVYASGDDAALDRCAAVFSGVARGVHRLGPFGTGTRMKLVANLLVAVHIVSAAEALLLARAAGLDLSRALEALTDGAGTSRMLEVRGPMMATGGYSPASMTLRLFAKDESLIREFASNLGVPVPLFEDASRMLRKASGEGRAEQDTSAVYASLVDALPSRA